MNILYCFEYAPEPQRGGASRLTYSLVNYWRTKNQYNFYCFYTKRENDYVSYFTKDIQLDIIGSNISILQEFILDNAIDIVINQMSYSIDFFRFIKKSMEGTSAYIISVYHSMPGWEVYGIKQNLILKEHSIKFYIKKTFSKLYLAWVKNKIISKNQYIYKGSDMYIVLSESYIKEFCLFNKLSSSSHLYAIPNPISFNITDINWCKKENKVLVVSRFSEFEKRLSLVLKVWAIIEQEPNFSDWSLTIVGFGPDESLYKKMVNQLALKSVYFEGKQEPNSYYEKSSVFLMTSAFEGFSLTLLESMQYGVVPIVMASFSSVYDLIQDGKNGILVSDLNIELMAEQLKKIMQNKSKRHLLALQAHRTVSTYYSLSIVADKWEKVFQKILKK